MTKHTPPTYRESETGVSPVSSHEYSSFSQVSARENSLAQDPARVDTNLLVIPGNHLCLFGRDP